MGNSDIKPPNYISIQLITTNTKLYISGNIAKGLALIIAFELQVENFCFPTRKANQPYLVKRSDFV